MLPNFVYRLLTLAGPILFFPAESQAYLDPGSGSMMLQAVLGGLLAGGALLRHYWARIRSWIGKKE